MGFERIAQGSCKRTYIHKIPPWGLKGSSNVSFGITYDESVRRTFSLASISTHSQWYVIRREFGMSQQTNQVLHL